MKSIPKIILIFSILLFLYACSDSFTEDVIIENINSSEISDKVLKETLIDIEDEGVYQLNTDKTIYIIFKGNESEYKNVEGATKDEVLQITFNKTISNRSVKQVYEIKAYLVEEVETIELIQNGENINFENIFLGN